MKIAYVITRADAVGGASIHVRDLARAMLERGHVVMVYVGGRGPVTEQFQAAGVPFNALRLLRRPIRPLKDLFAIRELSAALREFRPEILSLHTAKAGWIGRAVAANLRVPAIYTPHGWSLGGRFPAPAGFLFRWAEKTAARWAKAIVCVCQYERDLALQKGVAGPERLHVVYNAVHDIPSELRARPGTAAPLRIVSVARLDAPKDHATLLRALASLPAGDWLLDLVGDGPLENHLRSLAIGLGIDARVSFLGYQSDPAKTLAQAGVFVLSSRSEGFPRSVLEAMRAGLPIVASRVGGVPEAFAEAINGFLVPAGDAIALTAALSRLLEDRDFRMRLGAEARRTYEERFRFERLAAETEALYHAVLSSLRHSH